MMADRTVTSQEMLWAFVWWAIALVAALLVFFILGRLIAGDPAAGLVFGGVTFVLVGALLVAFGPGPAASPAPPAAHHAVPHGAAAAHHPAAHASPAAAHHPVTPAAPAAATVAEPVAPPVPPVMAPSPPPAAEPAEAAVPGAPISERVREAARAAGEAARAALADAPPAAPVGTGVAVRPAALAGPAEGGPDDLKKIKGVGPRLEELLHTLGIYHFHQIADWGAPEVAWMDSNLEGFSGRVTRDDWVGQAKLLAAGAETEFSRRVDKGEVY
jgi:NADH-quinone oxidoreductase subunit E